MNAQILLDALNTALTLLETGGMTRREEQIYSLLLVAARKATEEAANPDGELQDVDPMLEAVRDWLDANPTATASEIHTRFKLGYGRAKRIYNEIQGE